MSLLRTQIEDSIVFLNLNSIPFYLDKDLSVLTSFKIGGTNPLVLEPESNEQILELVNFLGNKEIPYKLLGGGSNVLISDNPDDFVIIRLGDFYKNFSIDENGIIEIGSAANTTPVFRKISLLGFSGTEFLSTIPGWVGGAVIQNAGCYGGEIFNFIDSVKVLRNNEIENLSKEQIKFEYRNTQFLERKDSIILSIKMKLNQSSIEEIEFKLEDFRKRRNLSQPKNKKSAGSVFKNPKGSNENGLPLKAWMLIDQVGLRGKTKGNAIVSPEHCNFIVNNGGATASDVHYLISLIQELVYTKFNIKLEREIEYFGDIS